MNREETSWGRVRSVDAVEATWCADMYVNPSHRRRGIGQLMGTRQHGLTDAAMDALRQPKLLDEVREEVVQLFAVDPGFEGHPAIKAAAEKVQEQMSIS